MKESKIEVLLSLSIIIVLMSVCTFMLTSCSIENNIDSESGTPQTTGETEEETTEEPPVKLQYNLQDYVGIYSNGQSRVIITSREESKKNNINVSVSISYAPEDTLTFWDIAGIFETNPAVIRYINGVFYEGEGEATYTDGSGRFVFNDSSSFIWEDDKDGIGNGETFTKCEPYIDKDFVGTWKIEGSYKLNVDGSQTDLEQYYKLNEDGSYTYRDDSEGKIIEGKWATVEVPFGDETQYYILPDDENTPMLRYLPHLGCLNADHYHDYYRSD